MKNQAQKLRSKVMKAAWTIFRKYKVRSMQNWSKALKRAWAWAKESANKVASIYFEFIVKKTEKAICVRRENKIAGGCYTSQDLWVPKSLVSELALSELEVPMWFAKKLVEQGKLSNIDIL